MSLAHPLPCNRSDGDTPTANTIPGLYKTLRQHLAERCREVRGKRRHPDRESICETLETTQAARTVSLPTGDPRPRALPTPSTHEGMSIEERIRDVPELFFIWESSPTGMAFVDANGTILAVNKSLADFLGYSPGELRGMNFADVTSGPDLLAHLQAFGEVVAGDRSDYTMMKLYKPKMGTPRPAKLTVKRSPFSDTQGAVIFGSVLPLDAFEAAGVSSDERLAVVQQAIGDFVLRTWKIWLPALLALAGLANLGKIIDAFS